MPCRTFRPARFFCAIPEANTRHVGHRQHSPRPSMQTGRADAQTRSQTVETPCTSKESGRHNAAIQTAFLVKTAKNMEKII